MFGFSSAVSIQAKDSPPAINRFLFMVRYELVIMSEGKSLGDNYVVLLFYIFKRIKNSPVSGSEHPLVFFIRFEFVICPLLFKHRLAVRPYYLLLGNKPGFTIIIIALVKEISPPVVICEDMWMTGFAGIPFSFFSIT